MQQQDAVTLSQLGGYLKQIITDADIATWIVAEIHTISFSRHCYIECVEKSEVSGDIIAKMKFNIWGNVAAMLLSKFEAETGQTLQAGMKIMFYASVHYHEVYGLSGTITDINSNYTLGDLERQRRETIQRLTDEGVVDMNKMHKLPLAIHNVAVVSSDSAAGYGDFCNQMLNNGYGFSFNIQLFHALVQGNDAPQSIISALDSIASQSELPDVVVVIRGGGSKADLLCFDDYDLACNMAQFPCPIITGIGHERDNSVCDMVAHTRTKTPTAAAEFIIGHNAELLVRILDLYNELKILSVNMLQYAQQCTDQLQMRLISATQGKVQRKMRQVDMLRNQLVLTTTNQIRSEQLYIKQLRLSLQQASYKILRDQNNAIAMLQKIISVYNPTDTLRRGFTITTKNGKRIRKASGVKSGDVLVTTTFDGDFISVVR